MDSSHLGLLGPSLQMDFLLELELPLDVPMVLDSQHHHRFPRWFLCHSYHISIWNPPLTNEYILLTLENQAGYIGLPREFSLFQLKFLFLCKAQNGIRYVLQFEWCSVHIHPLLVVQITNAICSAVPAWYKFPAEYCPSLSVLRYPDNKCLLSKSCSCMVPYNFHFHPWYKSLRSWQHDSP